MSLAQVARVRANAAGCSATATRKGGASKLYAQLPGRRTEKFLNAADFRASVLEKNIRLFFAEQSRRGSEITRTPFQNFFWSMNNSGHHVAQYLWLRSLAQAGRQFFQGRAKGMLRHPGATAALYRSMRAHQKDARTRHLEMKSTHSRFFPGLRLSSAIPGQWDVNNSAPKKTICSVGGGMTIRFRSMGWSPAREVDNILSLRFGTARIFPGARQGFRLERTDRVHGPILRCRLGITDVAQNEGRRGKTAAQPGRTSTAK